MEDNGNARMRERVARLEERMTGVDTAASITLRQIADIRDALSSLNERITRMSEAQKAIDGRLQEIRTLMFTILLFAIGTIGTALWGLIGK